MAVVQQTQGRVLVVTLDAPGVRNALDRETILALRDLFEALAYREPPPPRADSLQLRTTARAGQRRAAPKRPACASSRGSARASVGKSRSWPCYQPK